MLGANGPLQNWTWELQGKIPDGEKRRNKKNRKGIEEKQQERGVKVSVLEIPGISSVHGNVMALFLDLIYLYVEISFS